MFARCNHGIRQHVASCGSSAWLCAGLTARLSHLMLRSSMEGVSTSRRIFSTVCVITCNKSPRQPLRCLLCRAFGCPVERPQTSWSLMCVAGSGRYMGWGRQYSRPSKRRLAMKSRSWRLVFWRSLRSLKRSCRSFTSSICPCSTPPQEKWEQGASSMRRACRPCPSLRSCCKMSSSSLRHGRDQQRCHHSNPEQSKALFKEQRAALHQQRMQPAN
mmetsp:Transcript_25668/g.59612  ORF Transcript_25668/g.59612 Transcript_25668/m.59612 type:complete len:216 (-) Transcript_25668:750-1397(-)